MALLAIKPGVKLKGMTPQISLAADICRSVYEWFGEYDCTITSCTEGKHKRASAHYSGRAIDIRTRHIPESEWADLVEALRENLGPEFDVILEADHIHVEWDPKA